MVHRTESAQEPFAARCTTDVNQRLTDLLTDTSVEKTLRDIVSHRQVVCFKITDPLDAELPLWEVRADGWKQADQNGYVDAALAQRIQRRL